MPANNSEKLKDDLEPAIRAFHRQVTSEYERLSPGGSANLARRRAIAEQVRAPWTLGGPVMAETLDLSAGSLDVPIRIHRPVGDRDLPVMIYVHGGGWMLFSLDTHDRLMREYAARANVTVVGVEYSLAPEARFPTQIHEIVSVVRWLRSRDSAPWLTAAKIAIGGDSAGANLAVATNLALRQVGEPVLDAMLLNYGAFDLEPTGTHDRFDGPEYMLTPDEMAQFWDNYLPDQSHADPLARPLLANLQGLPPAFLCIAECDILADENWQMVRRLEEAAVPVVARGYQGATHSFLEAVSASPLADRALGEAAQWLSKVVRP